MIGERLNHYRIIDKLGEGGMAEVYLAEDTRLGRRVALKVLPPDLAEDPSRIERFEREAKAVAALNHPNIVTIYSVEEANGIRFLTMELVDGDSLQALIPADGMTLPQFFELAGPLLDAVAAAHRKGITHRDVKPANVMVNSEGTVKLLDLGLAKLDPSVSREVSAADDALTREGRAIGTVPYMAPEQLAAQPADHRVDIYALGVVFYEMLTGRRPFKATSTAELISAILRDPPRQVSEFRANLPDGLADTVERCLEKQPDDRFQSVDELRTALDADRDALGAGVAPAANRGSGHHGSSPDRPSRPRWLIVGAIAVVVAVAAGLVFSRFLSDDRPTAAAAELSVALLPFVEGGAPIDTDLAADLRNELLIAFGSVQHLTVVEPAETENATATDAGETSDYRLEATIDWLESSEQGPAKDGPAEGVQARLDFELTRTADGSVIWSETFDRPELATLTARSALAATVRARVGELLGLPTPPAPTVRQASPPDMQRDAAASKAPSAAAERRSAAAQQEPSNHPVEPAVAERPAPGAAASDAVAEIELALRLTSSLPTGVVTIYADGERVYQESFEFSGPKRGILGRVGLKRKVAGEREDGMLVPAATTEIRAYVAVAKEPARQFAFEARLRGDGTDRLSIDIRNKRDIDVVLE